MSVSNLHQISVEQDLQSPSALPAARLTSKTTRFQIDLQKPPPDETLLDCEDLTKLLADGVAPWRRFGERLVYVTGGAEIVAPRLPDGIRHVNYVSSEPELIKLHGSFV